MCGIYRLTTYIASTVDLPKKLKDRTNATPNRMTENRTQAYNTPTSLKVK